MKDYLNLGCGNRFYQDWVNIDFVSSQAAVRTHNLANGIPFENNSFSVVYHSHMLEHFTRSQAILFIRDCFRVLKPGGVIRVIVPDLQQLAEQYLEKLKAVEANATEETMADYEWSVIEMIDQMVRQKSGGEMLEYWQRPNIPNENLLVKRMGNEYLAFKKQQTGMLPTHPLPVNIRSKKNWFWRKKKLPNPTSFEESGEKHKWMYDRYSLKTLLQNAGFHNVRVMDATTSAIADWHNYHWLDLEDGKLRKPDSLIMEGIKSA